MTIRTHKLKIAHQYWEPLITGEKSFEVRRDDRGFQRGDILEIQKMDEQFPHSSDSFAKPASFEITYILTGGQYGVEAGYVVMGVKLLEGEQ